MRTVALFALAGGLLASNLASAQSRILYQNSFEAREIGSEWSSNTRLESWYPSFSTFNGNYSSEYTELTLRARPPGSTGDSGGGGTGGGDGGSGGSGGGGTYYYTLYTVTFDFYAIDSWDGNDTRYGKDRLMVTVNGRSLMNDTFSNHAGVGQSFRAPDIGGRDLGFDDRWADSIYRRVSLDFTVPDGEAMHIRWADGGLQGRNDESWGIDNVMVTSRTVPGPGGLTALGVCGLMARRRRR